RDRARLTRRERQVPSEAPDRVDESLIADDSLRLIAMCCHPLLPTDAQIALTLRMVAGLTTEEIARGFHQPVATVAQRIVRAKRTLAENKVTFATDEPNLASRLPSVLDVVLPV